MNGPLSKRQFQILTSLMNDDKCFDTHDNCFQLSVRSMSSRVKIPKSSISDLFKAMRIEGLLDNVVDCYGVKRLMVNPTFMYWHTWHDKRFHRAMYVLGSHEKAVEWINVCRLHSRLYDPRTGEDIGFFDTEDDLRYAGSYSRNDRDKIHQRDGYKPEDYEADGEYGPSMADCQILYGDPAKDREVYERWKETGEMDYSVYGGDDDRSDS